MMSDLSSLGSNMTGVKHEISGTAQATAMMRALAAHDPRQEIRGADNLAELFLAEEKRAPLKDPKVRDWVMKNRIPPGAYEFMIARTAFFDEVVRNALGRAVPQLVILGAGYDSRAYRFAHLLGEAVVFELDSIPTQLHKKRMLERGGVQAPSGVRLVPIDFTTDDIERTLLSAGFSKEKAALFIWEGVSYYLSRDAVDSVLAAVRTLSGQGNSLYFDIASLSAGALSENGIKKLRQQLRSNHSSEPTRFGIPSGKLESFLANRGYAIEEVLTPAEMEARYLTLSDGSTIGKVPALFNLVHARTS
jgi:methyltransferase (TIGR00027 family)